MPAAARTADLPAWAGATFGCTQAIMPHSARTAVFLSPRSVLKVYLRDGEARYVDGRTSRCATEVAALRVLSGTGLPVPRVLDTGTVGGTLPWLLMSRLPGEHPRFGHDDMHWSAAARPVQHALGRLLGELHASVPRPLTAGRHDARRAATVAAARRLRRLGVVDDVACAAVEATAADLMPAGRGGVLLHGDYGHRNVLVDAGRGGRWAVTGLIDLEEARAGDPTEDLVNIAFGAGDSPGYRAFRRGYAETAGPATGPVEHGAALRFYLAERAVRVLGQSLDAEHPPAPGYLLAARGVLARLATGRP